MASDNIHLIILTQDIILITDRFSGDIISNHPL